MTTIAVAEFDRPTRENAVLWQSPEKDAFHQFGAVDRLSYDLIAVPLCTGVRVCVKFRVTSYEAEVLVDVAQCPGFAQAATPPGRNYRSPVSGFHSIGEWCWGENGSGFNQKYLHAMEAIRSICEGDWTGIRPLIQSNRTTSFSLHGDGGENTRFWSADLTQPLVAHAAIAFPLQDPFSEPGDYSDYYDCVE